jgi:ribosomal-protein-alanine N-acetyltransferase
MESPDIKPATEAEREWAAALLANSEPWITLGATLQACRHACHDPEYLLYIAHREGAPCGAIILHRKGVASSPYVKSIAVSPETRSSGIGEALMEFAEDLFRPEARHIFLCVSSFNTRARAFYERLGYRAVGEFEDYVVEGASEILMHKRLR